MVNLIINNKNISVEEGTTILEAAKKNNISIPTLCHLEGVHSPGSCRMCVVEVEGARNLMASCVTKVREGMVVYTNTERVRKARKVVYELLLSNHPKDCLSCERNQNCEFQQIGELMQVNEPRFEGEMSKNKIDASSLSIIRDSSKCILCRRCVTACNEIQGVGILNIQNRGFNSVVAPAAELPLGTVNCTNCGQCVTVCPVGALQEKDGTEMVWKALADKNKRVIVQTAPAIRAAIGEEFGYEPGTLVTGKLATALRELGFDDVFDTNFTADLTIIEEGTEFLKRAKNVLTGKDGVLPMITSCSPGWVKFIEHEFPEEVDHVSTCKSPQQMMGAVIKAFYAKKIGVDAKDIFVVSVMPCTAKKYEAERPEMTDSGYQDVDIVLTTRELAKMIKTAGINFKELEDSKFDNPLGYSTGAADIFGTTGGVMEAALRTVYELVTGRELPFDKLHVEPIVGLERIKEAEITIENVKEEYKFLEGFKVKVAVTSGLAGARNLLDQVAKGTSPYHFIEVMACPGGCLSGGGQPRMTDEKVRQKRMEALYKEDEGKKERKSHENPYIKQLYDEFLGEPLGHKSHELLHTHYTKRGKYNEYLNK